MPRFTKMLVILLALMTSGCDSCDGCSGTDSEADLESRSGRDPKLIEGEQPSAARGDASAPSEESVERPDTQAEMFRSQLEDAMKRLGEAARAGMEAEKGDSHCERALTGMNGMIAHLAANAEEGTPLPRAPDPRAFIQLCESLAVEAQRCMMLSYSQEHHEECQRVMEELSPADVQRIQAVAGGQ